MLDIGIDTDNAYAQKFDPRYSHGYMRVARFPMEEICQKKSPASPLEEVYPRCCRCRRACYEHNALFFGKDYSKSRNDRTFVGCDGSQLAMAVPLV